MKIKHLLILLALTTSTSFALEINKIDSTKFCVYKSVIYSKGAIIALNSKKVLTCKPKENTENSDLVWVSTRFSSKKDDLSDLYDAPLAKHKNTEFENAQYNSPPF